MCARGRRTPLEEIGVPSILRYGQSGLARYRRSVDHLLATTSRSNRNDRLAQGEAHRISTPHELVVEDPWVIAESLNQHGMRVDEPQILTAVTSASRYMKRRGWQPNCLVLNEGDIAEDLEGFAITGSSSADVVLLGGAGPTLGYSDFEAAFTLALKGVPLVAFIAISATEPRTVCASTWGHSSWGWKRRPELKYRSSASRHRLSFTLHWTKWGAKRPKR